MSGEPAAASVDVVDVLSTSRSTCYNAARLSGSENPTSLIHISTYIFPSSPPALPFPSALSYLNDLPVPEVSGVAYSASRRSVPGSRAESAGDAVVEVAKVLDRGWSAAGAFVAGLGLGSGAGTRGGAEVKVLGQHARGENVSTGTGAAFVSNPVRLAGVALTEASERPLAAHVAVHLLKSLGARFAAVLSRNALVELLLLFTGLLVADAFVFVNSVAVNGSGSGVFRGGFRGELGDTGSIHFNHLVRSLNHSDNTL